MKAAVFVAALAWVIRAGWGEVLALGSLEGAALRRRRADRCSGWRACWRACSGSSGWRTTGCRYWQFESMLRTTPEEQREDQRTLEGDVTARAHRRRIALAWRGDSPELLAVPASRSTDPAG